MRFLLTVLVISVAASSARADSFDHYTNAILAKVPKADGAMALNKITPAQLVEHARALPGLTAALVVVKTNEGRLAKLLVQPARQKVGGGESVPILWIERYVTYREGEEKTIHAQGQNVRLFDGFRFHFDIGQVVPEKLAGDIRFVVDKDDVYFEPVGKAELFLVTKHLPEATPKKALKPEIGEKFEPTFFNGTYKLYDDGRRSGTLKLNVLDEGEVTGWYFSDKDGKKYEVYGKIGKQPQAIAFRITFPRSMQHFTGLMFTGDGRVITGSSRLEDRDMGFYAVRQETE